MPDNYIPSSVNNSGNSMDSLYLLNADTKQRFNNMLADVKEPIKYTIPEFKEYVPTNTGLTQSQIMDDRTSKGAVSAGIFSDDPQQRQLALNTLNNHFDSDPVNRGVGVIKQYPYDKSMNRYLNSDFGYNPYVGNAANEEFNYENDYMQKSMMGKVLANTGKGLTRFVAGVGLKAVQTLGYMGGLIVNGFEELWQLGDNAVGGHYNNNAMADIADNTLARLATGWEEDMKNSNLLQVFKPKDWDDMGFFNKMRHGAFWSDEFSDGAAFMGEMVLSSYALGGLGKLAGLGRIGEIGVNMGAKWGAAGKALDFGVKFLTGAEDIAGIGRWAFNTGGESAMEASQQYDTRKATLEDLRDRGVGRYAQMTDEQITREAGEAAASSFKMNLAILSLSNAFENKMIFEPLMGGKAGRMGGKFSRFINVEGGKTTEEIARASRKVYDYKNKVGKFLNWKDPNSRLRFYGSRAAESTLMEGFWEENAQLATERLTATDRYQSAGDIGKLGQFVKQLGNQTVDALTGNDPQAATSIGLGGVIGIIGTGTTSKVAGAHDEEGNTKWMVGERRQKEDDINATIAGYEDQRRKFFSFNNMYDVQEDGSLKMNDEKAIATIQGLYKHMDDSTAIEAISDPLLKTHMQNSVLADFVYAAKDAGIYDRSLARIQGISALNAEEIKQLGFDPSSIIDVPDMTGTMEAYGKFYDEAEATRKKTGSVAEQAKDASRANALFKAKTTAYSSGKIANEYLSQTYDEGQTPIMSPLADEKTSDVVEYNSLLHQESKLEDFAALTNGHTDFFKEHIAAERKRIRQRKSELREGFDSKVEEGKLVEGPDGRFHSPVYYGKGMPNVYYGRKGPAVGFGKTFPEFDPRKQEIEENPIDRQNQDKHAEMVNVTNQYNYMARKFSGPNATKAYDEYIAYIQSVGIKDEAVDAATHTVKENKKDGTFEVVNPAGEVVNDKIATEEDAQKVAQTATAETVKKNEEEKKIETKPEEVDPALVPAPVVNTPAPNTPVATNVISQEDAADMGLSAETGMTKDPPITDHTEATKLPIETISESNPYSWNTPLASSKDDTTRKGNVEQLRDIPYMLMRTEFIKKFMLGSSDFNSKYNMYIVKDVFPEIVNPPFNNTNTPDYIPKGEVIIIENQNGKRMTVGDFFGDQFDKKGMEMSKLPIVFPFAKKVFGVDENSPDTSAIEMRAKKRAEKMGGTTQDSIDFYNKEMAKANKARALLVGPEDKIRVSFLNGSYGIMPTVKGPDGKVQAQSVMENFGKDFTLSVNKKETTDMKKGAIVATFGKVKFPVGTTTLQNNGDQLDNIQKVLAKEYLTHDDAEKVRNQFLNVLFYTNAGSYFVTAKTADGKFKLYYKVAPKANYASKEDQRRAAKVNNDAIGELRFNISDAALENGMNYYNVKTGVFEFMDAEQYLEMVKPFVITSFKKTLDKEGNLYMKPVNPHFTFSVIDSRVTMPSAPKTEAPKVENKTSAPVVAEKKNRFDEVTAKIKTIKEAGQLDGAKITEIQSHIKAMESNGELTAEQHTKLHARLEELRTTKPAPEPVPVVTPIPVKGIPLTQEERLSFITKATPEEYNTEMKRGYEHFYISTKDNKIIKVAGVPFSFDGFDFFIVKVDNKYNIYEKSTGLRIGESETTQKAAKEGFEKHLNTINGWKETIKDTTSPLKTAMNPVEVTPTVETPGPVVSSPAATTEARDPQTPVSNREEKKARAAAAKQEAAKGEVKNVTQVLTGPPAITEYKATVDGVVYTFDQKIGAFTRPMGKRNMVLTDGDEGYVETLEEVAQKYPFSRNEDGTVSGFYRAQLEGIDGPIIAYGLPSTGNNEIFIQNDAVIGDVGDEGEEISPVGRVREMLTDAGKTHLEEFLKRNC